MSSGSPQPASQLRTDEFGRTLRRALVDITPPRNPDDVDGDGHVSDPERLVCKLRELAEQLALEALLRPGKVDPARLQKAIQLISNLADELATRIEEGGSISREDLVDIAGEAVDIFQWACERPDERDAGRPEDSPALDGRVAWRSERPDADPAAPHVIRSGPPLPVVQRVTWIPVTDARESAA